MTAVRSFACTCARCVAACETWPGTPSPLEAMRALSVGMGKRYMLQEFHNESGENPIWALVPATVGREGRLALGALAGVIPMACTFLTRGMCEIHHSGFKPQECRELNHRTTQDASLTHIIRQWDTLDGRRAIGAWKYFNKEWRK